MFIPQNIYGEIIKIMPIPCVDLLVTDETGLVLLLKRKNEPAKNQWWFPGGRVLYNETRNHTVLRKLKEECNLEPSKMNEIGTFDLLLNSPESNLPSHAITTLFYVLVISKENLKIDEQSSDAKWLAPLEWLKKNLHWFVKNHICYLDPGGQHEYH